MLVRDKEFYIPFQLTFKSPAEHKIRGERHDLEMQISLKKQSEASGTEDNKIAAVMSVFFSNHSEGRDKDSKDALDDDDIVTDEYMCEPAPKPKEGDKEAPKEPESAIVDLKKENEKYLQL